MLSTTQRDIDEHDLGGAGSLVSRGHYSLLPYSCAEFDFPRVVTSMLDGTELELVGANDRLPLQTRATDQTTCWHRLFYDRFGQLRSLYEEFVRRVVARLFREPFYYQAVPTFRVHLPGNMAVGEFHIDSTYGHPEGEVNIWVPLTRAFGTNSVWIESAPGRSDFSSVDVGVGEALVFDAARLRHGNRINETGRTRVSFDLRCLRVRDHRENNRRSINAGLPFAPGGYYAAAPIVPRLTRQDDHLGG